MSSITAKAMQNAGVPGRIWRENLVDLGCPDLRTLVQSNGLLYDNGHAIYSVQIRANKAEDYARARLVFLTLAKELVITKSPVVVTSLALLEESVVDNGYGHTLAELLTYTHIFITDFHTDDGEPSISGAMRGKVGSMLYRLREEGKGVHVLVYAKAKEPIGWFSTTLLKAIQADDMGYIVKAKGDTCQMG